jgi:CheY-like chemotaxis protein
MSRILVVDDEASNRDLLSYVLTHKNHQVRTASNGTEALQTVRDVDIDLAIIDLEMAGMDGYTLARWIRVDHPETVLVAVTAAGGLAAESATAAGFDGYYSLPVEPADFLRSVRAFLDHVPQTDAD